MKQIIVAIAAIAATSATAGTLVPAQRYKATQPDIEVKGQPAVASPNAVANNAVEQARNKAINQTFPTINETFPAIQENPSPQH